MINCPKCHSQSSVLESRTQDDNTMRRRRECVVCLYRWSTREISNAEWRIILKARKGYAKGGKRGGKKSLNKRRGFSVPLRLKKEYYRLTRIKGVHAREAAIELGIIKDDK